MLSARDVCRSNAKSARVRRGSQQRGVAVKFCARVASNHRELADSGRSPRYLKPRSQTLQGKVAATNVIAGPRITAELRA
jgi:hypothetical protein